MRRMIARMAVNYLRNRGYLVMENGGPQMIVKLCLVQRFSDHFTVYPLQGTTKGISVGVFLNSQLIDCTDPDNGANK